MKTELGRTMDKNLVCAFVPYWGSSNPYQDELAKSLELQGIKVEKGDTLKSVFHDIIYRRYRLDILHLHWLPTFGLRPISLLRLILFVLRLSILRVLGVKIVWTAHNLIPHESKYHKGDWLVAKLVTTLAQSIIVHGETARKEVISTFRLKNPDKTLVIPHGNYIGQYPNKINRTMARKILGIPDSKIVMLFLGGIRSYKGVLELIKDFKLLNLEYEDAYLMIAGRAINDEVNDIINKEIEGHENIRYKPGFVPAEDIQVYMNACEVCVFPYKEILTSGAVILAMSFGRACIAPKVGDICDTLDARGAFLYEPENECGLVAAMRRAAEKRSQLEEMGEYNRLQALQRDWRMVGQKTKEVYLGCLS